MPNNYSNMPCPRCQATTTWTKCTSTSSGEYRRTRVCPKCEASFNTYEIHAQDAKFLREARKLFAERGVAL